MALIGSESDVIDIVDLLTGNDVRNDNIADHVRVMSDGADMTLAADPAGTGCCTDIAMSSSITASSSARNIFIPDGEIQGEI